MAMAFPATAETLFEAFPDLKDRLPAEIATRAGQIELRHGTLPLPGGKATLALTPDVYALDAEDAKYVIETLWGNPPSPQTLGMIFPGKSSPFDEAWAVELTYDPMGYVSDEEAAELDPDALLATMQEETRSENELRQSNGYPTVSVIGWAVPPAYDAAHHKLHWAKELKFSDTEGNTLNYNIRILGRHGVLVANFIASMALLPEVQKAAPSIMDMINFDTGARYSDFQPGVDTVAAVGIGGLIATKVAAKTGLLVVALALLKKGWFLLLLPLIWAKNLLFKKRTEDGSA
ncbi:DUF2167 domain-containing protein [Gemmobacter denitrificans]|uniref:DUF2167 domain-containing protein n=1 Tax=Gemmobacter denitrificans TaxID=3123040 RepID=A0ABU8BUG4_9RHOB